MTIKDTIRVKGYPSHYGTWFMRNYVPKSDSRIVAALRAAGLVLLGRTAMPTAAFDWNCRNQRPGMKRPQGRQAQKQATRARILEVARTHFERDGFAEANVRAIAADSDVAVGTVLLHFTDKLGLLHAALCEDLEAVIDQALRKSSRGTLLSRVCGIVQTFFDYYALRPNLSRILLRESWFAESPWKEKFGEQALRVSAHMMSLVEDAKAKGEIYPTSDAQLFGSAFLSYYFMALLVWVQGGLDSPMPFFKASMADYVSRLAPAGPRKSVRT